MSAPIWITDAGTIATVNEGSIFNFILQATNDAGTPFTYTLISGQLPAGLTLDSDTGTIYGTLPLIPSDTGSTFTVRATNIDGISDRTFTIIVVQDSTTWITGSNLGTVIHESFLSLQLLANEPGDTNLQYTLISGDLPTGITFHSNGFMSGYLAAISVPYQTYTFTVEADGAIPATRTFTLTVTSLGVHSPQWNTISAYELGNGLEGGNLGNIFNSSYYSFQLESVKPAPGGPGPLTYTLISGTLPPGLTLSSSGLISGTLSTQLAQIWPIIIQVSDGLNNVSAVFYFQTNFITENNIYWVVNYNTIPVDLSSFEVNVVNTFSVGLQTYQITKSPTQVTFDQNLINQIINNTNLTLTNSLIVVFNSAGNYTLYQNYSGQLYNAYNLVVLTSPNYIFDLGDITIAQPATMKVNSISLSTWIRYELLSGTLPLGLTLNINTGNIEGTAILDSSISYPATYNFTVRSYNSTLTADLDFSIEVVEETSYKPNKLTVRIGELGKIDWYTLRDLNLIPHQNLYREGDIDFGTSVLPEVTILSEIDALTPAEIMSALPNNIPATLYPANFIYTPVTDINGNVICEALLLKLVDSFRRSSTSPSDSTNPNIKPGGIEAIRQTFINSGQATNALENWMNYYFTTDLSTNQFIINDVLPDFLIGDAISFHGQTLPSPFENDLAYYVIPLTSTTFQLAASESDAVAGNFIPFNVNATSNVSGTLQFFFPALPLAYINTGSASAIAANYNAQENIVPFGYYTANSDSFTDVFFTTLYGNQLNTGDPIKFWDEPLVGPFIFGQIYYVIEVNPITFQLAATKADALANNPITIVGYIDDRTGKAFAGSFKKLLLTQNNTVVLDEADTRFSIPVDTIFIDSRYKLKPFTTKTVVINSVTYNNAFYLPNHGLETTMPVEFSLQLNLPAPLLNDTVYYVIVLDSDYFQLAVNPVQALSSIAGSYAIVLANDFSGLISVDTAQAVFINQINTFEFSTIVADNVFITNQISAIETGDIVQLTGNILAPFTTSTPYSVIRMSAEKSFQLADISTPTIPLIIVADFTGNIVISGSEYDVWRS